MYPYPKQEQYGKCASSAQARVLLDEHNSDLNFAIEPDGLTCSTLHDKGFEYLWAGARATHGVATGKAFYEVVVQEKLDVILENSKSSANVMRVGWSVDSANLLVGEAPLSYGFGGTGKSSCNNKFYNYGEPYSSNDVVTCYIDLDASPKAVFFTKNGKYLGVAFSLGPEADGKVFYPHVSAKNMRFVANFGGSQPYFPPVPGFSFMEVLPPNLLCVPSTSLMQPEVLMMVGLPSCGKTTWLEKFVRDHPEKKYYVLGTNEILCKMKVMGLSRKRNYHGRWDALIKQASGILNEMLKIAQRKSRNYILDQTNVYASARRRKINNFRNYKHIAVVIVNSNDVLMSRNAKVVRSDGKVIPESVFMEMKANFTLPVEGEIFDEVWYVEENRERSMHLVQEFNWEGGAWKEEQKKRPADDSATSKGEPGGTKKPKYDQAPSRVLARNQYGNTGPQKSRPPPTMDSYQKREYSSHNSQGGPPPGRPSSTGSHPPPPRHHNQFPGNNSQHNRPATESYYPSDQHYGQPSPTQSPYPQVEYRQQQYAQPQPQIPKSEFPQPYQQPSYGHGKQGDNSHVYHSQPTDQYAAQGSRYDQLANYSNQHYPPVAQNWSSGQQFNYKQGYNQGQYRFNYQYQ